MSLLVQLLDSKPVKRAFNPYQIVSLWDMLRFYADDFVKLCTQMSRIHGYVDALETQNGLAKTFPGQISTGQLIAAVVGVRQFKQSVKELIRHLQSLGLNTSVGSAETLLTWLPNQKSLETHHDRVREQVGNLIQTVRYELKGKKVFMLSSVGAEVYDIKGTVVGKGLINHLKEIEEDAVEAGRCFAVGRYTACAFHLMRVMEHVVQKFAERVGATFDPNEDTWGNILGRARDKISQWEKVRKRPSARKKKYLACCDSMNHLCSRRNDIMHIREFYTEERVNDLMGAVKTSVDDYLKLPDPLSSD